MELTELLPCPFCGGPVVLEPTASTRDEILGERKWWGVVCRNAINVGGSCAVQIAPSASKEAATKRWNRRANTAILTRLDLIGELTSPEYISRLRGVMGRGEVAEVIAAAREVASMGIHGSKHDRLIDAIHALDASPVAGEVKG